MVASCRRRSTGQPSLQCSKDCRAQYSENDQTRSFCILTTGMFNLIVKDPRQTPPERAAGSGSQPLAAVLELVALHFARFPRLSRVFIFCQAFPEVFYFPLNPLNSPARRTDFCRPPAAPKLVKISSEQTTPTGLMARTAMVCRLGWRHLRP